MEIEGEANDEEISKAMEASEGLSIAALNIQFDQMRTELHVDQVGRCAACREYIICQWCYFVCSFIKRQPPGPVQKRLGARADRRGGETGAAGKQP